MCCLQNGVEPKDEQDSSAEKVNGSKEHAEKNLKGSTDDKRDSSSGDNGVEMEVDEEVSKNGGADDKHCDGASGTNDDSVCSEDTPAVLLGNGESGNESQDAKEKSANKVGIDSSVNENDDSQNPSLISDDSRDSVQSVNSDSKKDSLVETVKDGDDDILITLNNDEDDDEKKGNEAIESPKNVVKDVTDLEKKEIPSVDSLDSGKSIPPPPPLTPAPGVNINAINSTKPAVVQGQAVGIQIPGIPPGAQLAQQGNQLGYITNLGNQTLFVPISVPALSSSSVLSQLSMQQQSAAKISTTHNITTTATVPQIQQRVDLKPKSSWEMIELMRWEVQNRVPDNYNWSIIFHPKKEELSSVTSFLQELGSDVVKEQVYKDIIQIQTKKKESDDLKEAEVDSLEKMKTVYENTKKKVEHLQLETLSCKNCDFKTESPLIMDFHKDFPHYDPPWDVNRGSMLCSFCNYRTKVLAQFIFHMMDVHKRQARFVEKDQFFQCPLCPFNARTKLKLDKHLGKCAKNFKLQINLYPYFQDINYCMKTCFYKPKKPPPPKPPAQVKPAPPKTAVTMTTRQTVGQAIHQKQQQQVVRPVVPNQARPAIPAAQMQQQRPTLNPARLPLAVQQAPRLSKPNAKEMSVFEVCEICGGYVKDRQALRIHFYYAHKIELPSTIFQRDKPPLVCDVCKSPFWTTQGLTKHKTTQRHFSSSGSSPTNVLSGVQRCFMCTRKVYNLFAHIEQAHGMTMKDLVLMKKCIVCGITAVDRKTLEAHLASTHGILIKASDFVNEKSAQQKTVSVTSGQKPAKNIGQINFCVFCEIQFPDNIQLTVHCMKKHATCKECGMVVPNESQLDKHKCMKANRKCYVCGQKNMTPDSYAVHLRRHVKACKVKIENLSPEQIEKAKEKLKREYKPAVISLDSDEDSEVEVVEDTKPSKTSENRRARAGVTVDNSVGLKDNSEDKPSENADKTETSEEAVNSESNSAENDDKTSVENADESEEAGHNSDEVEKEETNEKLKESSDKTDKNDVEMEEIDEDKLLGTNEESNDSSGSLKRKRQESDIDEDELLKDDDDVKRPKTEIEADEHRDESENIEEKKESDS